MTGLSSAPAARGCGLVKLKIANGKAEADEVYFKKGLPSSIGGAVLRNNLLFGTNANGLLCIDFATGKELWQNPSVGPASICYADGRSTSTAKTATLP